MTLQTAQRNPGFFVNPRNSRMKLSRTAATIKPISTISIHQESVSYIWRPNHPKHKGRRSSQNLPNDVRDKPRQLLPDGLALDNNQEPEIHQQIKNTNENCHGVNLCQ